MPLCTDVDELSQVNEAIQASGIPFMPEFARRFYPTTLRLRELLATSLGKPRMVVAQGRLFHFDRYGQPGPSTQMAPASLLVDPGSYLLDWCRYVFQAEPTSVQGWSGQLLPDPPSEDADYLTYLLEFGTSGLAQVSANRYHRNIWGEANRFLPTPGIQVYAERGAAWLEMPDRIQWTDPDGVHEEKLALEPSVGECLNDQFYRLIPGRVQSGPRLVRR